MSTVQFNPFMHRGAAQTEAVDTSAGPVEKSVKAPQAQEASSQLTAVQVERLTELLRGYAMKATPENTAMLKLMLENGIPLTKENILQFNHAMKLTQSADKALFMLQNNIRLTQSNAAQLDGLVNGQIRITDQIRNLLAAVDQLNDTALAAKLKQLLANIGAKAGQGLAESGTPQGEAQGVMQGEAQATASPTPGTPIAPGQQAATQASPELVQTANQANSQAPAGNQAMAAGQPESAQTAQSTGQAATQQGQETAQQPLQGQQTTQGANPQQNGQAVQPGDGQAGNAQATNAQASNAQTSSAASQGAQASQGQGTSGGQALGTQPQLAQPPASPQSAAEVAAQASQQGAVAARQSGGQQAVAPQTQQQSPTLPENLLFRLADSTPQDIERFINSLRETVTQVQQALAGRESGDTARVMQEARALEAHIDFASQIKNHVFMQIPLFNNGQESLAALHIYKDGKKSGGSGTGSSSALIALETAGMGHFETYVQKNSRSVHCQFRLESDKIVQAVRNNIHKLDALLKEHNFTLDSFTFLPPDKPYTLLDSPKIFEDLTKAPVNADIPHFDERA